MEILRSGQAESYADAARQADCDPGWLSQRWQREETRTPPFKQKESAVDRAARVEVDEEEAYEPTDLEKELAAKVLGLKSRAAAASAEARTARSELSDAQAELEKARTELDLVLHTDSVNRPDWTHVPKQLADRRATLLALFSDFHAGEVVAGAETNGYNAYDVDICEARIRRFFERTITVSRQYLAGVSYDGVVVPSLGDTISGDIHDEFKHTNELSNYEAVPFVVPLIEEGLGMLADEFGKVHYVGVPGNHPRDSKQPRYKKRSAHNADTLVSKLLAAKFRNDDRITFDIPAGIDANFTIYNTRFHAEHGDEAKGGGGIQGALAPLALLTHRRRTQANAEGVPFDVALYGHWHQLMFMISKGFICNGAGKGYDEYAKGKGFEPEPPQQALCVVTPEHGVSMQCPLYVSDPSEG
jgi:hypothetical protein